MCVVCIIDLKPTILAMRKSVFLWNHVLFTTPARRSQCICRFGRHISFIAAVANRREMCARPMAIQLAVGRTAGSWRCQIRSIRMRCSNNHKTTKENIPTTSILRMNREPWYDDGADHRKICLFIHYCSCSKLDMTRTAAVWLTILFVFR